MVLKLSAPFVQVHLEHIPIASAGVDRDGVILIENRLFTRMFADAGWQGGKQRLADLLSENDRPSVEGALETLEALGCAGPQRLTFRAVRRGPPFLPLTIHLALLALDSPARFLLCVQAVPHRRRADAPIEWRSRGRPAVSVASLSDELCDPLTAIRGWAQMAQRGVLPPDKLSQPFSVIGRNAASLCDRIERACWTTHALPGPRHLGERPLGRRSHFRPTGA
jgi:nitrogen-specific signal transduction histidine kinase